MNKIYEKVNSHKNGIFILSAFLIIVFVVVIYSKQNKEITVVSSDKEEDYVIDIPSSEYIPVDANYATKYALADSDFLGIIPVSNKKGYETGLLKYPLLVWETYRIVEEKGRISINIEYPHFWGNGNGDVVKKLNFYIEKIIQKRIDEDKNYLNEMVRDNPDSFESTLSLSTFYRVIGVTNGVVSFEMVLIDFTGGGNGNHEEPITVNWDLKSNRLLANNELFCSKNYIELLIPFVREQLIKRLSYDYGYVDNVITGSIDNGITPEEDNWEYMLVKPDGIIVVFPPYQVSSGASGTVRVFIPNSSIPNLLCLP